MSKSSIDNSQSTMAGGIMLVSGIGLAALLLIFMKKLNLYGVDCYYFGNLRFNSFCVRQEIYFFGWAIAVALIGLAVLLLAQNASLSQSSHDQAIESTHDRKWAALVEFDPEIRAAHEKVAPL